MRNQRRQLQPQQRQRDFKAPDYFSPVPSSTLTTKANFENFEDNHEGGVLGKYISPPPRKQRQPQRQQPQPQRKQQTYSKIDDH